MTNKKLVKVCGMREGENIRAIEQAEADMIGFIFYPKSPRYLHTLPSYLPTKAKRVGVFVNETAVHIETVAKHFALNYVQLHGCESPEFCNLLQSKGISVIKSFALSHSKDVVQPHLYEGSCDYYLFDTQCEAYGGSGIPFDWSILRHYQGNTPFLLSGGISLNNIEALKRFKHPRLSGYDINSCFETAPGKKDITSVSTFIKDIKTI